MDHSDITALARLFEEDTGFEPQTFRHMTGTPEERAEALACDLDWYRRHTEGTHQRLLRALRRLRG